MEEEYSIFIPDNKKEHKLMREYARKWKRYKICTPIFYAYIVLGIIVMVLYLSDLTDVSVMEFMLGLIVEWDEEYWLAVVGVGILFIFLPACFINAMRLSGGRDIFVARMQQQILLNPDYFCNAWIPRFSNIEPAKHIEYRIRYEDITRIDYNASWKRLEIYGKRSVFKDMGHKQEHLEEDGEKPYVVYEYFEHMEKLKQQLCSYTGLTIQQI